jgi:hypothetical protein
MAEVLFPSLLEPVIHPYFYRPQEKVVMAPPRLVSLWRSMPALSAGKELSCVKKYLSDLKTHYDSKSPSSEDLSALKERFHEAKEYLEAASGKSFFGITRKQKKTRAAYYSRLSLLKLQVRTLQSRFNQKKITVETSDKKKFQRICGLWHKKMLRSTLSAPLTERRMSWVKDVCDELPQDDPDVALMRKTMAARKKYPLDPNADAKVALASIAEKAGRCYALVEKEYEEYIPLLLEDKNLQGLFQKQVVRDKLTLEVFFRHVFVADFLRSRESLERSVAMAGDTICIGKDSKLPEIKFEGRFIPAQDLPGYSDATFKNMIGWYTFGMAKSFFPCSIEEMKEKQKRGEYENGYTYTHHKGLVPWNPRTWEMRKSNGEWEAVDIEKPQWWKDLPPYRVKTIPQNDDKDMGWRLIQTVSHTEDGPQFEGTHSMACIAIPLEKPFGGKVKVGYYPFGRFAYLFDCSNGLKAMTSEVHYLDQCIFSTDRAFTSLTKAVTPQQGEEIMEVIKTARKDSLEGKKEYKFTLYNNNCTDFVRSISRVIGEKLVINMKGYRIGATPTIRFALKIVQSVGYLRKKFMLTLGAEKEETSWDYTLRNPFPLRMFFQMKVETEELQNGNKLRPLADRCAMPF